MPTGHYIHVHRTFRLPVRVIGPSIAYLQLTKNSWAVIDAEDMDRVSAYNSWYTLKASRTNTYAANKTHKCPIVLLHRLLFPSYLQVDHINGNGLHNWKGNLRPSNQQQNLRNQRLGSRNTSGFKGVSLNGKNWRAALSLNGKMMHLGTFKTREEAHEVYCSAAKRFFGEFANDGIMTLSGEKSKIR